MKNMKRGWLIIHLVIICAVSGFSQKKDGRPDFSGNWTFDRSGSSYHSAGIEQIGAKNFVPNCAINMKIQQTVSEIKIISNSNCRENGALRDYKGNSSYFTDERGDLNKASDGSPLESVTKWDGNEILITYYRVNSKGKKVPESIRRMKISKKRDKLTEIIAGPDYEKSPTPSSISSMLNSYTEMVYKLSK